MPLSGEYEPSPSGWARKQAERYEASDGEKGGDLRGRPVHRADLRGREDRQAPQDRR